MEDNVRIRSKTRELVETDWTKKKILHTVANVNKREIYTKAGGKEEKAKCWI